MQIIFRSCSRVRYLFHKCGVADSESVVLDVGSADFTRVYVKCKAAMMSLLHGLDYLFQSPQHIFGKSTG